MSTPKNKKFFFENHRKYSKYQRLKYPKDEETKKLSFNFICEERKQTRAPETTDSKERPKRHPTTNRLYCDPA